MLLTIYNLTYDIQLWIELMMKMREKRIRRRKLIGHDGMDINVASEEDSLEVIK